MIHAGILASRRRIPANGNLAALSFLGVTLIEKPGKMSSSLLAMAAVGRTRGAGFASTMMGFVTIKRVRSQFTQASLLGLTTITKKRAAALESPVIGLTVIKKD